MTAIYITKAAIDALPIAGDAQADLVEMQADLQRNLHDIGATNITVSLDSAVNTKFAYLGKQNQVITLTWRQSAAGSVPKHNSCELLMVCGYAPRRMYPMLAAGAWHGGQTYVNSRVDFIAMLRRAMNLPETLVFIRDAIAYLQGSKT